MMSPSVIDKMTSSSVIKIMTSSSVIDKMTSSDSIRHNISSAVNKMSNGKFPYSLSVLSMYTNASLSQKCIINKICVTG